MAGDLNYFVLETKENLQRFTNNLESIISKYDREFSDDEEIDISTLEDVKINGIGRLSRQRPRAFGNSRLLTTKRREQSILSECRSDVSVNKTLTCHSSKDNKPKVLETSDNSDTSDDFIVWRDKSLHNNVRDNNNSAWGQTFNLSPKGDLGLVPSPTDKDDEVDGGFIVLKDKCENALSFLESDSEEPSDGETLSSFSSSSCSDREDVDTEDGYDVDTDEVYTVLSSCSDEDENDIQIVNLPRKTEQFSPKNFKKIVKEKTRIKNDRDNMRTGLHIAQKNEEFCTYSSTCQAGNQCNTGVNRIMPVSWTKKNVDTCKSLDHFDKWHYTQGSKPVIAQGTERLETTGNFNKFDTHAFPNQTDKCHSKHNPEKINTGETHRKSESYSASSRMNVPGNRLKNGIRKRRYRPVLPEISSEQIIAYLNGNDVNISALYSPEILKKHRNKLYNKSEETRPQIVNSDQQKIRQSIAPEVDMKCITAKTGIAVPISERIDSSDTVKHTLLKSNGQYRSGCSRHNVPVEGSHDAMVFQTWSNRNENNFCQNEMIVDRGTFKEKEDRKYIPTDKPRKLFNGHNEQMATFSENTKHSPFRKSARDLHDIDDLVKPGFNSPDFENQKIPGYTSKSVPAKCLFSTKTSSNVAKFMKMKERSQCSENKVYKWSTPSTVETSSDRFTLKARRRLSLISSSTVSNSNSKWIQDEEQEYSGKVDDPYDFSKYGDSPSTHLSKLRLQTPPSKHPESGSHSINTRLTSNLQTPPSKHPESGSQNGNNRFASNFQTPPSKWQESKSRLKNNAFPHKLQAQSLEHLESASFNMEQAFMHKLSTPPSQRAKPVNYGSERVVTHKLNTPPSQRAKPVNHSRDRALMHKLNTPPSQRPKLVKDSRDTTDTTKQQNMCFPDGYSDRKVDSASNKLDTRCMDSKQFFSLEASEIKSSHCGTEQRRRVGQMSVPNHGGCHSDIRSLGPTDNKLTNYVCISSPPARKKFDSNPKYWTSTTNNSPVSARNTQHVTKCSPVSTREVQQHVSNNSPISGSRKLLKSGKFWNSNDGDVNKGLFDPQIKLSGFKDKRLAIIHPQNGVFKKPNSVKSDVSEIQKDVKNDKNYPYKNGHNEKGCATDANCNNLASLKYFQSTPVKGNKKLDLNDTLSTIYDCSQDSSDDNSLDEIMTISPSDIE